jgi:lipoate-protein ligase A
MSAASAPAARVRVIDTGRRSARWNLAMTAALAHLHRAGATPDTLRFLHFPASVLIGRHQDLARAACLDHCRARGIELARRPTGGGAVYMDPGVLAWEIVADRGRLGRDLEEAAARVSAGIAAGLARLGIAARFRPPHDVVAEGRKICGSAGLVEGRSLLLQGTLLVEVDVARMAAALMPPPGMGDDAHRIGLASRLVDVASLVGRVPAMAEVQASLAAGLADALGLALEDGAPSARETALAARLLAEEIGTEAFVAGAEPSDAVAAAGAP